MTWAESGNLVKVESIGFAVELDVGVGGRTESRAWGHSHWEEGVSIYQEGRLWNRFGGSSRICFYHLLSSPFQLMQVKHEMPVGLPSGNVRRELDM